MGRIPAFPLGCDNIPQPIPIYFPQFRTRKPRFPNRGHRSANSALAKFAAAQRRDGRRGPAPRTAPGAPGRERENAARPGSIPSPPGKTLPLPPAGTKRRIPRAAGGMRPALPPALRWRSPRPAAAAGCGAKIIIGKKRKLKKKKERKNQPSWVRTVRRHGAARRVPSEQASIHASTHPCHPRSAHRPHAHLASRPPPAPHRNPPPPPPPLLKIRGRRADQWGRRAPRPQPMAAARRRRPTNQSAAH